MNNTMIGRKFPVYNHVVDLSAYDWKEYKISNDEQRPYDIELLTFPDPEKTDIIMPYYRSITAVDRYEEQCAKHSDETCDPCKKFQLCFDDGGVLPKRNNRECDGKVPRPRKHIIIPQKKGFVWVVFNTRDLLIKEE